MEQRGETGSELGEELAGEAGQDLGSGQGMTEWGKNAGGRGKPIGRGERNG
jgi:hypothetical protein